MLRALPLGRWASGGLPKQTTGRMGRLRSTGDSSLDVPPNAETDLAPEKRIPCQVPQ